MIKETIIYNKGAIKEKKYIPQPYMSVGNLWQIGDKKVAEHIAQAVKEGYVIGVKICLIEGDEINLEMIGTIDRMEQSTTLAFDRIADADVEDPKILVCKFPGKSDYYPIVKRLRLKDVVLADEEFEEDDTKLIEGC